MQEVNSTEISNCSFINQTDYVLNNALYVDGSSEILIKNNTIQSNNLVKGFTHGIYAEYCPTGNFNIISNTISNSGNGMSLINSSPFVVQNTLNGIEYAESGIFVDNVNGKFEYNVINDFYYSYYSFTSSPDLLMNTFNNSYDDNSSTPRETKNITLYDIGFGLKDTVFFYESIYPGLVQELYLEAYQKESSGEFEDSRFMT